MALLLPQEYSLGYTIIVKSFNGQRSLPDTEKKNAEGAEREKKIKQCKVKSCTIHILTWNLSLVKKHVCTGSLEVYKRLNTHTVQMDYVYNRHLSRHKYTTINKYKHFIQHLQSTGELHVIY